MPDRDELDEKEYAGFWNRLDSWQVMWHRMSKYHRRGEWRAVFAELRWGLRFIITGKHSWEK